MNTTEQGGDHATSTEPTKSARSRRREAARIARDEAEPGRRSARGKRSPVATAAGVGCAATSVGGIAAIVFVLFSVLAVANSCSRMLEPPCPAADVELARAAYNGDGPTVDRLVREGADVNERDPRGVTPLACAADAGRLDVAAKLLAGGADASTLSPARQDALLVRAAMADDAATTEALLAHGATFDHPDPGAAAPAPAPGSSSTAITQPTAADPDAPAPPSRSAVEALFGGEAAAPATIPPAVAAAVRAGSADVVRVLVQHGADPDDVLRAAITDALVTSSGPLDLLAPTPALPAVAAAPIDRRLAMAQLALELGADPQDPASLDAAATADDPRFLASLLDRGADPNTGGGTLLAHAAAQGRAEQARQLLARGADPNLSTEGGSALLWASAFAHGDIVDALLAAGADPNGGGRLSAQDVNAAVAFAARQQGQPQAATAFVDRAIGPVPDGTNVPPLLAAATWDHWDIVARLLAAGADPDRPLGALTSSSVAAAFDHAVSLRALLDAGASPGTPGPADPLPIAQQRGATEVEALLHAHGR